MQGINSSRFGMALSRAERAKLETLDEVDQQASQALHDSLQKRLNQAETLGRRNLKDAFLALADTAQALEEGRQEKFPHVKSRITVFAEDKPSATIVNDTLNPVEDRIRSLARRWADSMSLGRTRTVLRALDADRKFTVAQAVTQPLFDRIERAMSRADLTTYVRRAIEKTDRKENGGK